MPVKLVPRPTKSFSPAVAPPKSSGTLPTCAFRRPAVPEQRRILVKSEYQKAKGAADPMKSLADPGVWELFRKIAANKALRDQVAKLAEKYPDPASE